LKDKDKTERQLVAELTELRQRNAELEAALQRNGQLSHRAVEASGAVPYCRDYRTNAYEFVGAGIQDLTGYSSDEFTPLVWDDIMQEVVPTGRFAGMDLAEARRQAVAERSVVWTADYRIRTRNAEERWVASFAADERDESGAPLRSLGILLDITERRELEERLRHVETMEAMAQLAGGIAHDFNNQLAGITALADLLKDSLEDEQCRGYADMIANLCAQSKELTARLLAFSRKGKYELVAVDLHEAVSEVVSVLKHRLDKRIKLEQRLNADPPTTMGDPTQLRNVLLNLAFNARDAMPDGGQLLFAADTVELDAEFCRNSPHAIRPGRYVRLTVTDTGVGMDTETRKRMFDPFFTTKTGGDGGAGMGLASVYGTIVNHHGAIAVESKLGRGAAVTVYLPLAQYPGQERKREAVKSVGQKGKARILLVDDNKVLRMTTAEMLRNRGYQVTTCKDGAEAVEHYRKSYERIDLVILDMTMPRMGGHDAFVAMREINPQIKAILSTGYSLDDRTQEILDDGVHSLLQKPFRIERLCEALNSALGDAG